MMGGSPPPPAPSGAGEAPLSESKKQKLFGSLENDEKFEDLFDMKKAQQNIYEIENKLKDILNN